MDSVNFIIEVSCKLTTADFLYSCLFGWMLTSVPWLLKDEMEVTEYTFFATRYHLTVGTVMPFSMRSIAFVASLAPYVL